MMLVAGHMLLGGCAFPHGRTLPNCFLSAGHSVLVNDFGLRKTFPRISNWSISQYVDPSKLIRYDVQRSAVGSIDCRGRRYRGASATTSARFCSWKVLQNASRTPKSTDFWKPLTLAQSSQERCIHSMGK